MVICLLPASLHSYSLMLIKAPQRIGDTISKGVAILGNTTSPALSLTMTGSHIEDLDIIVNHYGERLFSFQMCPPKLFAELIKINHLRMRAVENGHAGAESRTQEAGKVLGRIHSFSPKEWSESKPCSREGWMLVGKIYQASMSLYCILSLQSLSVLPLTSEMSAQCTEHGRLLQVQLDSAMSSPGTKYSMIWPLVLLGVQAANGSAAMRAFVSEKLPELSYHIGSNVPTIAKAVLERFWASGETRWDACFDRPYAFVTQIAVDMSQLVQEG
ncbi:C6 zinc finger domain-containing protein [Diaporthe eres]|nr:C6 zinc finger domain-containing protein [Diaporthe eres]